MRYILENQGFWVVCLLGLLAAIVWNGRVLFERLFPTKKGEVNIPVARRLQPGEVVVLQAEGMLTPEQRAILGKCAEETGTRFLVCDPRMKYVGVLGPKDFEASQWYNDMRVALALDGGWCNVNFHARMDGPFIAIHGMSVTSNQPSKH